MRYERAIENSNPAPGFKITQKSPRMPSASARSRVPSRASDARGRHRPRTREDAREDDHTTRRDPRTRSRPRARSFPRVLPSHRLFTRKVRMVRDARASRLARRPRPSRDGFTHRSFRSKTFSRLVGVAPMYKILLIHCLSSTGGASATDRASANARLSRPSSRALARRAIHRVSVVRPRTRSTRARRLCLVHGSFVSTKLLSPECAQLFFGFLNLPLDSFELFRVFKLNL